VWAIAQAADDAINKQKLSKEDLQLAQVLFNFYLSKRSLFLVKDLAHTRLTDCYKNYNTNSGSSWFSTAAKPSIAMLPIGHTFSTTVRIYQPIDRTWLDMNSIRLDTQA
jgi:hypothetical protein